MVARHVPSHACMPGDADACMAGARRSLQGTSLQGTIGTRELLAALPAVQHLEALSLYHGEGAAGDCLAATDIAQRFAACAGAWRLQVPQGRAPSQLAHDLPPGSLAAVQHLAADFPSMPHVEEAAVSGHVASGLSCVTAAAPNITTLQLSLPYHSGAKEAVMAMVAPLRAAAHLQTIWLYHPTLSHGDGAEAQVALLEALVRGIAEPEPGPEGSGRHGACALRRVLLHRAGPGRLAAVLDACRASLARDGIRVGLAVDFY